MFGFFFGSSFAPILLIDIILVQCYLTEVPSTLLLPLRPLWHQRSDSGSWITSCSAFIRTKRMQIEKGKQSKDGKLNFPPRDTMEAMSRLFEAVLCLSWLKENKERTGDWKNKYEGTWNSKMKHLRGGQGWKSCYQILFLLGYFRNCNLPFFLVRRYLAHRNGIRSDESPDEANVTHSQRCARSS